MTEEQKKLLETAAAANVIPPPAGQLASAGIVLYTYANDLYQPIKALLGGKKPQWKTEDQQATVRYEYYLDLLFGYDVSKAIRSVLFSGIDNINFKERSVILAEFISNNNVIEKLSRLYNKYSLDFLGKKFLDQSDITPPSKKNGDRADLDQIIRYQTALDFLTVSNKSKNTDINQVLKGNSPVDAWKTIRESMDRYFEKYALFSYITAVQKDAVSSGVVNANVISLLEQAKLKGDPPSLDFSAGLTNPKISGDIDNNGIPTIKTAFGFDLGSGFIWVLALIVLAIFIFKK